MTVDRDARRLVIYELNRDREGRMRRRMKAVPVREFAP